MLRRWQRLLAYLYYLKRPSVRFVPVLLAFVLLLFLGGYCFHKLYTVEPLGLRRALYVTYALVFMEHILPFPKHWVLQCFYIILPPLGLVVILDGIIQYSLTILRRDRSSQDWNRAMIKTMKEHVILCGLGKAGLRTLQFLLRLGEQVCVLEKNPDCANLAFANKNGVPVLIGNGRQEGIFDELQAKAAKSIILATDDDLSNLEMALDARKINKEIRIVLRLFDQELAAKVRESFDFPLTFSTTSLAAPLFATASSDRSIVNAFTVDEELLVVARLVVESASDLVDRTVRELENKHQLYILSHRRDGQARFHPARGTTIAAKDELVLQCDPDTLKTVQLLNKSAA